MSGPIHATTVAIGRRGVLIEGASGGGKSDLALRLIDRGAVLVSDDYTLIAREGDTLYADAPATIAGRMEVRGVGIVEVVNSGQVPLALAVALGKPARLPEPATRTIAGVVLPAIVIDPHEPSAPIKVEMVLAGFPA